MLRFLRTTTPTRLSLELGCYQKQIGTNKPCNVRNTIKIQIFILLELTQKMTAFNSNLIENSTGIKGVAEIIIMASYYMIKKNMHLVNLSA